MGEGREQHLFTLPEYRMSRFPVTNVQYAWFIKAGGYRERRWWTDAGWAWREKENVTRPEFRDDGKWNGPDLPVVVVSWYEAVAFSAWAARTMGEPIRLPTEAEWEKAASWDSGAVPAVPLLKGRSASLLRKEPGAASRLGETRPGGIEGGRGKPRIYPWGDKWDPSRCNSFRRGPERTTAVGTYSPQGDSPYGCADMAGNVWEWCSSLHAQYPYRPDDGREAMGVEGSRVLRGGSWFNDERNVRAALRDRIDPSIRDNNVGFRCASTSP